MATPNTPATPFTPSTIASSDLPWRKKVPFNLIGRGVAGIDEMQEYLEDTKVYFGIVTFEIGSGSFKRNKSIFIHFNGEKHPKPLQRAKANKKIKAARKLFSPYNVELVLENTKQCTIDYFFSRLKNIFVSDNAMKGQSTFDIGSLKDEYKKKMKEARKKAKAEKERLELQRQKLLAQEEEEKRIVEEAKRKAEEEERLKREAEEAEKRRIEEEERLKREAEEAEKRRIEEEERKKREAEEELERLRLEKEKKEKEEAELEAKKKAEEELKLKKPKKRKRKKRTKDDWSDDREWTGKRIVKCIHAQTSPMNWAVFKPSDQEIIPMAFGHGDLNDLRAALKGDQVQYGIMRLTFGEGRFRRSHWVFVCWSPDTMTKVDSQKLRKKRMQHRMKHIGNKGWMQKAIGPYGVEVLAESHDQVTLEDWILRVRKTVVVDGNDELMNADAFRKALEAEKEHFAEMQRKKDEERKKKQELEKKLNDNESSSEEELYDKELAKKNKKKRKRKKKDGNDNDSGDDDENDENKDENDENKDENDENDENKDENIEEEKGDDDDDKKEENKEDINGDNVDDKNENVDVITSLLTVDATGVKEKRKSSIDPSVIKARDVSSQLCYESITLIKRPDTDLVWVLIEPRLKGRR